MADGNSCFRIGKTSNIDSWNVVTRSRIGMSVWLRVKYARWNEKIE